MNVINLAKPVRSVRERGFQPPWHTVWIYECSEGHEVRVRANAFRGSTPVPGTGGISCPQCERINRVKCE